MEKRQALRKVYVSVSAMDSGNVLHEFLQNKVEKPHDGFTPFKCVNIPGSLVHR